MLDAGKLVARRCEASTAETEGTFTVIGQHDDSERLARIDEGLDAIAAILDRLPPAGSDSAPAILVDDGTAHDTVIDPISRVLDGQILVQVADDTDYTVLSGVREGGGMAARGVERIDTVTRQQSTRPDDLPTDREMAEAIAAQHPVRPDPRLNPPNAPGTAKRRRERKKARKDRARGRRNR